MAKSVANRVGKRVANIVAIIVAMTAVIIAAITVTNRVEKELFVFLGTSAFLFLF